MRSPELLRPCGAIDAHSAPQLHNSNLGQRPVMALFEVSPFPSHLTSILSKKGSYLLGSRLRRDPSSTEPLHYQTSPWRLSSSPSTVCTFPNAGPTMLIGRRFVRACADQVCLRFCRGHPGLQTARSQGQGLLGLLPS